MVITIINQHANNFGDEAACLGVINKLLEKKVDKINLIYIGKGTIHFDNKKVKHNREINVKNIGKFEIIKRIFLKKLGIDYRGNEILDSYLKIIEESDVIFVSPAGADIGRYRGWAALCNLYLVDSCDKKIIFHLNTIGDSGDRLFNYFAEKILKKSLIYVREMASFEYLNKKGIDSVFGIDSAFLLPNEKNDSKISNNIITFIPTELSSWNREYENTGIEEFIYKNIITTLFDYAQEKGYNVVLLPHLGTDRELEYYNEIISKSNVGNNVSIATNINSVYDYQQQICESRFVVSMRYHGVILAAKNNIPFISIAYENKMFEASKYMGVVNQNIALQSISISRLREMLEFTDENLNKIKEEMKSNLELLLTTVERPIEDNVK